MGLLFGSRPSSNGAAQRAGPYWGITSPADLVPPRPFQRMGAPVVTQESALRHSAVWACLRIRADLISTFPLDVYRRVNGVQIACPPPPVLVNPEGKPVNTGNALMPEFMYSTQVDLDRIGNTIGVITKTDGFGNPSRIELAPATSTQVIVKNGKINKYRIDGTLYDPSIIWHEKAYTLPGLHVGLSPIMYAAWSIGEYLSVQEFATDWFSGGAVPRSRLKNTQKTLNEVEAAVVKESWKASVAAGEPFVHGADWEYDFIQAQSASNDWLEAKKYSITDVARFLGVPSDLIDSAPTGATRQMTYANITQRNLQLLVMNLGPAIIRRESALSGILVQPRYVKLNTDSLLRLDPLTRAQAIETAIQSRTLAPSEARELENRAPFTDKQLAEFDRLFGVKYATGVPAIYAPSKEQALSPAEPPGDSSQPELEPSPELPAIEGPGGS